VLILGERLVELSSNAADPERAENFDGPPGVARSSKLVEFRAGQTSFERHPLVTPLIGIDATFSLRGLN
jgi:hypothetical protein